MSRLGRTIERKLERISRLTKSPFEPKGRSANHGSTGTTQGARQRRWKRRSLCELGIAKRFPLFKWLDKEYSPSRPSRAPFPNLFTFASLCEDCLGPQIQYAISQPPALLLGPMIEDFNGFHDGVSIRGKFTLLNSVASFAKTSRYLDDLSSRTLELRCENQAVRCASPS